MTEFNVFYSWQSDSPNATNWTFIEDALEKACKRLSADGKLGIMVVIDRDTRNVPGSPSIPRTILSKIDAAHAIVADCTTCYQAKDGTESPNPNVMYELGYARARLGEANMILVVNTEFGTLNSLPFDLEKRRAIGYDAKVDESNRSEEKTKLVRVLEFRLREMVLDFLSNPSQTDSTTTDRAIEAIENKLPTKITRVREFWAEILERLESIQPRWQEEGDPPDEKLYTSVVNSETITADFLRVCRSIAECEDTKSMERVLSGFGDLLKRSHLPDNFSGGFNNWWFDFWRFIGNEFFLGLSGMLMDQNAWEMMNVALSRTWTSRFHQDRGQDGIRDFGDFDEYIELFNIRKARLNSRAYTLHGELLAARYGKTSILGNLLSFESLMAADFILAIRARTAPITARHRVGWFPDSIIYLKQAPEFLVQLRSPNRSQSILLALGVSTLAEAKAKSLEVLEQCSKMWPHTFDGSYYIKPVIEAITS